MTDPVDVFWASLESDPVLFTTADLSRWPEKLTERLLGLKLLRPTDNATHVVSPGCDEGHVEEVTSHTGRDGVSRFFVRCPQALRAEVPEDLLRQWTVDFAVLVRLLSQALDARGRPKQLDIGRLWRIGKAAWREARREVYFARGLAWPDGQRIAARIPSAGRPITLVADSVPPEHLWSDRAPPIVPLSRVASLDDGSFEMDLVDVAALVNEADMAARLTTAETLQETPSKQLKKIIRQTQMTALTDEALVRAYVKHGSYRKAADALVAEGHETDRWAVERAVKKFGGIEAVRRVADSQSIRRTVASQRRDGKRIIPKNP